MIMLLLLGGAAAVAGYAMFKSKGDEEKLIEIAQDHRARAARLQVEYERCSRKLASYNPVLEPKVMMAEENTMNETGESEGNL